MSARAKRFLRVWDRLTSRVGGGDDADLAGYAADPVGYAQHILGVTLTPEIALSLTSLLQPPYKVSVDSGHGVGKTFGAAVAANWWYDTRPESVVITTAPTQRDVIDLLWTEIRLQRQRAKVPLSLDFTGPAAPEMRSGPDHYAKGYTARKGESFQGRHRRNQLFIFDEKEGVESTYWQTTKTMFRPGAGDAWLVIGNPTTTTSAAYLEHRATDTAGNPAWHRVRISALDHPNVLAGLRGEAPPIPGAVTAEQVDGWIADWCDPVAPGDRQPSDIEWRGWYYRPGPIGEPRILGLRPSAGTYGVWSEALWRLVELPEPPIPVEAIPVIGCDVANYGDDYTETHTRAAGVSLRHHAANGWDHLRIADHLMREAEWAAAWANARRIPAAAPITPPEIPINLEDDATGRAVGTVLTRAGYRVIPCNASGTPQRPDLYRNVRSELWFQCARKAALGLVNLSRIDRATRAKLEQQAMTPEWWPTAAGHREVEPKDETKKKFGRSPDGIDAVNLSYRDPLPSLCPTGQNATPQPPTREVRDANANRRGLWGRR